MFSVGRAISKTKAKRSSHAVSVATFRDYVEMTKPRITFMVVLTTMAGFYMGAIGSMDIMLLMHTMIGTAIVVASANTLNQLWERQTDVLMERTRNRPLPAGRLDSREALASGIVLVVVGLLQLFIAVNTLTALLAFIAWVVYLLLYTPLKKRTSLSTLVGGVSGALPPMIGWAGARGALTVESTVLFLILFFWQLPHFLAIAWMYRDDYARAEFAMTAVADPDGSRTARQIIIYSLALVLVSLMPTLLGLTGRVYFAGTLLLCIMFVSFGIHMAVRKTTVAARHLLRASLVFLPVLFLLMAFDKWSF